MFPANGIQIYLKGTGCKAFSVPRPPRWNCLLLPQLNLCFNLDFKTHLCSLEFPSHGISSLPLGKPAFAYFHSHICLLLGKSCPGGRYFVLFFIGVHLLYGAVFVSAVQQSESAMYIYVSPLFCISFPFMSPGSTEWSSLCCRVGSHDWLSVLCIVVYLCQSQSPNSSPPHTPHRPSWCPYVCSLHLFLCFCFSNKIIYFQLVMTVQDMSPLLRKHPFPPHQESTYVKLFFKNRDVIDIQHHISFQCAT